MEITAQVLARLGDKQALLLLQGNPILVKTPGPLEEGSEIQLRMIQQAVATGGNVISRDPLKADSLIVRLSRNLVMGYKPPSEWMGDIWEALRGGDGRIRDFISRIIHFDRDTNPFSIPNFDKHGGRIQPEKIRELLLDRGINYESKINKWASLPQSQLHGKTTFYLDDTKGLTLFILRALRALKINQPQTQSDVQSLLVKLEEGLQRIEQQQLLNAVTMRDEEFLTLPFPVGFQKERTTVTIRLGKKSHGRKSDRDGERKEVVFLLELRALGKIRIDALLRSKSISVKIGIAREDLVSFVKPFLPELKERLGSSGLQVQSLDCLPLEKLDKEEPILKRSSHQFEMPLIDLIA
jgi:hypothetical protein